MTALAERVRLFQCFELPGQPMTAHMGTVHLVADLWQEVERNHREIANLRREQLQCADCDPVGKQALIEQLRQQLQELKEKA